jgi:hypothetical protein
VLTSAPDSDSLPRPFVGVFPAFRSPRRLHLVNRRIAVGPLYRETAVEASGPGT